MTYKIPMQKGRERHRKFHNARMSKVEFDRMELAERPSVFFRTIKGGYNGLRRAWSRCKPCAFHQRFAPFMRALPQYQELPVRHPRIRLESI